MAVDHEYMQAIQALPNAVSTMLMKAPIAVRSSAREIRLRAGRPPCIVCAGSNYTFDQPMASNELQECFRALCGYSVHAHTEEICRGFLTIKGGHRAGLSGTAVYENQRLINLRCVSSINLRIARQVHGAADELIKRLHGRLGKLLIVGAPASGKTTLLKDIVRQLSGDCVSVIDSRGEIAACFNGIPQNDMGSADIFDGWRRSEGMLAAVRTMSPDYIVCDELGDSDEIEAVGACVGAGAQMIATAHAGNIKELLSRPVIRDILKTGAFDTVVLLTGKDHPCSIHSIHKAEDVYAYCRSSTSHAMSYADRFQVLDEYDGGKKGTGRYFAND